MRWQEFLKLHRSFSFVCLFMTKKMGRDAGFLGGKKKKLNLQAKCKFFADYFCKFGIFVYFCNVEQQIVLVMINAQPTVFNSAQLYLLGVFSRIKSDEELNDIKRLVADYYAKKLDDITERMWESGELDQKRLDEINDMDLHQWLREQKAKEQKGV